MLRTALVALVAGAVLSGCGVRIVEYEFKDEKTVATEFALVDARTGSGDVRIRFQNGLAQTTIKRTVHHRKDDKPETDFHAVEGSTLVLRDCGNNCSIDYEIAVPKATIAVQGDIGSGDVVIEGLAKVDFKTGSGDITTRDIAGDVNLDASSGDTEGTRIGGTFISRTGSGNTRVNAVKGKVQAHTGSGDIIGTALDSDVSADATSGNVELNFVSERQVNVSTGSGDVTVRVPGAAYKVTGESGSGERKIDVRTDPTAKTELKLSTASGDVRVIGT